MKIPKKIQVTLKTICDMSQPVGGSSHAACICHKNKIVTTGYNQAKTHPKVIKYTKNNLQAFLHAEMDAVFSFVRQFDENLLTQCTLYVIRVNSNGLVNSKPCVACQRLIKYYSIGKVIHS